MTVPSHAADGHLPSAIFNDDTATLLASRKNIRYLLHNMLRVRTTSHALLMPIHDFLLGAVFAHAGRQQRSVRCLDGHLQYEAVKADRNSPLIRVVDGQFPCHGKCNTQDAQVTRTM